MRRINYCEVCGVTEQRRAAEIYDGIDDAPDACWQCERALKFEQERIIKLLEEPLLKAFHLAYEVAVDESGCYDAKEAAIIRDSVIALIKGEK